MLLVFRKVGLWFIDVRVCIQVSGLIVDPRHRVGTRYRVLFVAMPSRQLLLPPLFPSQTSFFKLCYFGFFCLNLFISSFGFAVRQYRDPFTNDIRLWRSCGAFNVPRDTLGSQNSQDLHPHAIPRFVIRPIASVVAELGNPKVSRVSLSSASGCIIARPSEDIWSCRFGSIKFHY